MIRNFLKTTKNILTVSSLGLVLSLLIGLAPVSAQSIADGVCKGIQSAEGGNGQTASSCFEDDDTSFGSLTRRVIDLFSVVVGAVSVIMIIIGGFRYIISG